MKKTLSFEAGWPIGALAERTGLNVPTIRYYEEIGLIPAARRRPSGHRYYGAETAPLLSFIRHCRDFGFSIGQVRELVSLSGSDERDCVEARDLAQAHLDAVRTKLAELRALELSLASFVQACSDTCAGGPSTGCTIFQDLATGVPPARAVKASCCG